MKSKKKLSLCMIVKDEETFIEKSLKSVDGLVDEIIVVDTGSTDCTVSIAERLGAKVYHYTWDNDFSHARNFSIEKATGDWILLLDADEVLEAEDHAKLLEFIHTTTRDGCHFKIYNYMDEQNATRFTMHYGFRLLKNNGQYLFTGAIHEQITARNGPTSTHSFATEEIRLHHYGYLKSVADKKNKRKRNLDLLLKQLEKDPANPFHLFNLGNEYMVSGQLEKAIATYEKSLSNSENVAPFTLHLYHRLGLCLYQQQAYHKALIISQKGLSSFPLCTDFIYCLGLIYTKLGYYTLALQHFNKCISLKDHPSKILIVNGTDSYKPYIELGKLYSYLKDYDGALTSYTKSLEYNKALYECLYEIGHLLNKKHTEKETVVTQLGTYFSSLEHLDNLYVFIDILLKQKLYVQSALFIAKLKTSDVQSLEKTFLLGQFYFYTKDYAKAKPLFYEVATSTESSYLFKNTLSESLMYLFILYFVGEEKSILTLFPLLQNVNNTPLKHVLLQLAEIHKEGSTHYTEDTLYTDVYLEYTMSILDKLLCVEELDLFEKMLSILNYISSKQVLLSLAVLYAKHDLKGMCQESILRSIKELDFITKEGAYLLGDCLL